MLRIDRNTVFFWKQPERGHVMLFKSGCMREEMVFAKGINITKQTVDDAMWYWFTLQPSVGHHLVRFPRHLKLFGCSGSFLLLRKTQDNWQRLAVSSRSNYHC